MQNLQTNRRQITEFFFHIKTIHSSKNIAQLPFAQTFKKSFKFKPSYFAMQIFHEYKVEHKNVKYKTLLCFSLRLNEVKMQNLQTSSRQLTKFIYHNKTRQAGKNVAKPSLAMPFKKVINSNHHIWPCRYFMSIKLNTRM